MTISLLSVKFLSMDNDVFFSLPFARKWRKHSRDIGISDVILYHFVLSWRVTLNRRICGNNLSQVNYRRSYALEKSV